VKFTLPFMKNGRSLKFRDEISIRGEGYNTLGVKLAQLHLHCINMSIAFHVICCIIDVSHVAKVMFHSCNICFIYIKHVFHIHIAILCCI
jgi:hypothetical protein